ncbi:DNA translocase FtsK [[Acholeplasma] multilocale]|uniref:DNA translocase FtsK n=1 Tax=[Acholeplasma] multilocale TaxID=264638 RepID=UPI000688514F|nr:DNA translocase FtsK [[Acholeplasma] multilocale]
MESKSRKTNQKVLANHAFNEDRTVAFNTTKKKYKQDSIAWIVTGLILFFFTLFSLGRITVVGQFFDDVFFNLIFGWFKFPVYAILILIDICIYAGIRFKFKGRFLGMVIVTFALTCWIISLSLMTKVAYEGYGEEFPINKGHQWDIVSVSFDIYWTEWLNTSIFSGSFYTETIDYFISNSGYVNFYSGGGVIGTLLASTTSLLSIPFSFILATFLFVIDMIWIFTGDAFYFFKKKEKRRGKGLRILSLKSRNNPNQPSHLVSVKEQEETHTGWNSLNVFDRDSDLDKTIGDSDLTIQMPSYQKRQQDLNSGEIYNFEQGLFEIEEPATPHFEDFDQIAKREEQIIKQASENVDKELESTTPVFRSRRSQMQAPDDYEMVSKPEIEIVENVQESILNEMPETGNFGDIDPSEARKMFERELNVSPFGKAQEIIVDDVHEKDEISDTEFFGELFGEEEIVEAPVETPIVESKPSEPLHNMYVSETPIIEVVAEPEVIETSIVETNKNYKLPPLETLKVLERDWAKEKANKENGALKALAINETFDQFGIKAKVINTIIGPSVTKFEIQPEPGTKVNSITALENDLKLALASQTIRLEAPIQGKNLVGIEIANTNSEMVSMREIIESIPKEKDDSKLLFVLGKNVLGEPLTAELNKMPHLLVAGSTGSGKSVMINTLICSILLRAKPSEVKFLMIDPKKVELSVYTNIPHMLTPVISDMKQAANALKMVVSEMERRYELFMEAGVRNIEGYNKKHNGVKKLPFMVVIIDELADLMMTGNRKEVEESIMRITQMARAAGIHLIVATQRPSVDVITGTIKTNIPTRIAFAVTTGTDSRTILDSIGAENLLGRGDMLFMPPGSSELIRAQGAYMSDDEIEDIVEFVTNQQRVMYNPEFSREKISASSTDSSKGSDDMFEEVKQFVIQQRKASTSLIQRKFGFGYNRAANIIDDLEAKGIIGPQNGSKPREVLVDK